MPKNIEFIDLENACIAFTNRHGGTSLKPYDSLNLGMHVGDDPIRVLQNRELSYQAINVCSPIANSRTWAFLNQTHENNIVIFDDQIKVDNANPPTADASITRLRNQPLVVLTADCGPLVIVGQTVICAIHASWKSLSAGIIATAIAEMRYLAPSETFQAVLGPCIHAGHYVFEQALLDQLVSTLGKHVATTTIEGEPAFDLPASIIHELNRLSIPCTNLGIDTFTSQDHFSYRRDGRTGRQGVIAWLK